MTQSQKIALGVATIWPFIWIVIFIASIFALIARMALLTNGNVESVAPALLGSAMGLLGVHTLTALLILGLTIYYIIHAIQHQKDDTWKIVWPLLIFFFSLIAMPIYWYMCIWKEPQNTPNPLAGEQK